MNEIFKNTQSFFSRLRSNERKTFRRFLELHEDGSLTQSKSLKLFDILNSERNIPRVKCKQKFTGKLK